MLPVTKIAVVQQKTFTYYNNKLQFSIPFRYKQWVRKKIKTNAYE